MNSLHETPGQHPIERLAHFVVRILDRVELVTERRFPNHIQGLKIEKRSFKTWSKLSCLGNFCTTTARCSTGERKHFFLSTFSFVPVSDWAESSFTTQRKLSRLTCASEESVVGVNIPLVMSQNQNKNKTQAVSETCSAHPRTIFFDSAVKYIWFTSFCSQESGSD